MATRADASTGINAIGLVTTFPASVNVTATMIATDATDVSRTARRTTADRRSHGVSGPSIAVKTNAGRKIASVATTAPAGPSTR